MEFFIVILVGVNEDAKRQEEEAVWVRFSGQAEGYWGFLWEVLNSSPDLRVVPAHGMFISEHGILHET